MLRGVIGSREYDALLKRLPEWKDVVERETQAMCADVLTFSDPQTYYDRSTDRLGYKVMDRIDGTVVYRYRTAFACPLLT